jgi:outer membrane protein
MTKSRQTAVACGVGVTLLMSAVLVARSSGQDPAVRQTSTSSQTAGRPQMSPAVIGSIDMEAVFKGYKKVEFLKDEIEVAAKAKQAQLTKLMSEAQQVAKEMESLQPGSEDFKAHDAKLTEYRVQLDTAREQAQKEFAEREAKALATIYKEIEQVVKRVAVYNKMSYVVRVSNEPISGTDPNSVMAAMSRAVVYSDPSTDITVTVVQLLNHQYQSTAGQRAARPAPSASANANPAATPATATPSTAPRSR